jgi:hypothetical protein
MVVGACGREGYSPQHGQEKREREREREEERK